MHSKAHCPLLTQSTARRTCCTKDSKHCVHVLPEACYGVRGLILSVGVSAFPSESGLTLTERASFRLTQSKTARKSWTSAYCRGGSSRSKATFVLSLSYAADCRIDTLEEEQVAEAGPPEVMMCTGHGGKFWLAYAGDGTEVGAARTPNNFTKLTSGGGIAKMSSREDARGAAERELQAEAEKASVCAPNVLEVLLRKNLWRRE